MLEGLEISEIKLGDVLFDNSNLRLDAEYFKKQYLSFFKNLKNLSALSDFIEDGYRVVYENTETVEPEVGRENNYPFFLQASDLSTPFIETENLYYVHQSEWDRYEKGRIKSGEILIEVKGKVEKVAIVPVDFPSKTLVTGSLYKATINSKISKNYLLSYLICKYGVAFKERYKTNLLISFISKADLYRIPVPKFSNEFESRFDLIFEEITDKRNQAKDKYAFAEKVLFEALEMSDFKPSTESTNTKTFSESFGISGRLDAEYYQPKYEEVIAKIVSQTHSRLVDIAYIKKSIEPGSDAYADEGLPFIRVSDYSKYGLSSPDKCLSERYVHANQELLESLKPKAGTVLFSKDGSVGTAYLLRDDLAGVTSGAILHLLLKREDVLPEYLTLVLNSQLVQMQAERDAGGSIILHWRVSEIENVVVPIVALSDQVKISELVQESFKLKAESERLLDVAKRAVEMAIEHDEAFAVSFLNSAEGK